MHLILINLRKFFYSNFCDVYVECSKIWQKDESLSFNNESFKDNIELTWNILRHCINYALLLYHPFIPSITEQLNNRLRTLNRIPQSNNQLLFEFKYPQYNDFNQFKVIKRIWFEKGRGSLKIYVFIFYLRMVI